MKASERVRWLRRLLGAFAVGLHLAWFLGAANAQAPPARPNVILVLTDDKDYSAAGK